MPLQITIVEISHNFKSIYQTESLRWYDLDLFWKAFSFFGPVSGYEHEQMDLQPDDEQAVRQCKETRLQSDRAKETERTGDYTHLLEPDNRSFLLSDLQLSSQLVEVCFSNELTASFHSKGSA